MDSGGSLLAVLFCFIFTVSSETVIELFPEKHNAEGIGLSGGFKILKDDAIFCDSWRFSVETNDAGHWRTIPQRCLEFVRDYMTGERYSSDLEVVAENSLAFARNVVIGDDGKDAWIFDIDETLLSNLRYYEIHGFGSEAFDEKSFDNWANRAEATVIKASLSLYKALKHAGFKIILLTGRGEVQRNVTQKNLMLAGYTDWDKLILRSADDKGVPAIAYKSMKRTELENEGYRIHGCSGDQWSDLLGLAPGKRSFKLPNPMYHIA